ncbi:Hypothetical predicted protein [Paramuricea clavata]|uniref:Uncharacterized protein n=1 Tax=Paramuricea clavata TaxID=317549 RepID=A0A6S7IQB9_PARCT|nr:Hypothetical predicted protein [Paramuricea clavata]
MTFNVKMTIWDSHIFPLWYECTRLILQYYSLILEEKSYIFEGVYFGVCSWRSFGQIKSKGAVHIMFFKKAVNCELDVPVPNLPGMCELAIFYTLYKRSVISLAGQSLTLAIIKLYTENVKRSSQQVLQF